MYDELVKRLREDAEDSYLIYTRIGDDVAEAADAIEKLDNWWAQADKLIKMLETPRWIPVTERLPEQGKRYLVIRFDEVTKTHFIDILWLDAHDLWWNRLYKDCGSFNVTHWMPLPEPPKEES